MENLIGQTINGRYRIEESLGSSGMADVYKVRDTQRSNFLALKRLRSDLFRDTGFLERFRQDVKPLEKLLHPNIVRFHGLEEAGGEIFMIMDYVERITLSKAIASSHGDPFTLPEILEIMQPVCSALHYAHQMGVMHGDLKPVNIMIEKTGWVQVAEFGIPRHLSNAGKPGVIGLDSPAYMAPELVRGESPTPQSDIYALGLLLFELLTGGKRPFPDGTVAGTGLTGGKIRWDQINLKPVSPRRFNPQIGDFLEWIVLKCLDSEPAKRFTDPLEILDALQNPLAGEVNKNPVVEKFKNSPTVPVFHLDDAAPPAPQAKIEPLKPSPTPAPPSDPPLQDLKPKRKSNWILLLGGTVILLAVLTVALINPLGGVETQNTPTPTVQEPEVATRVQNTPVPEAPLPTGVMVVQPPTKSIPLTQDVSTPIPSLTPFQLPENNLNGAGNSNNSGLAAIHGEWIYYRNDSDGGKMYRVNQDGSRKEQMNDDNSYNIIISGNWVFYRNDSEAGKLYRIPVEGGTPEMLNDEFSGFIFPAGDWVYYQNHTRGDMIYRVRMDGSAREKLTDGQSSFINVYKDNVYFVNDSDGHKIYRMQLDGSGKQKLTDDFSSQLIVTDDRIYYISQNLIFDPRISSWSVESTAINSMQLDGTGKVTIAKTKNGSINGYINVLGDWIYYIPEISYFKDKTGSNINIGGLMYRLRMGENKRETINDFGTNAINIAGDWIYYRKDGLGGKIYRMRLDGSGKESVS